jgi:hypothetical protein
MRRLSRSAICFVPLLGLLGFLQFPQLAQSWAAASPASTDWVVLFRSDDPSLWKTAAGDASAPNGYSLDAKAWPTKAIYLKLTRMDTGEAVIVFLSPSSTGTPKPVALAKTGHIEGGLIWNGGQAYKDTSGRPVIMLGICNPAWPATDAKQQMLIHATGKADSGSRGWGFSRPASKVRTQSYSWAGEQIRPTPFEIAVKSGPLTDDEKSLRIVPGGDSPTDDATANPDSSATTDSPAVPVASAAPLMMAAPASGPVTQLRRLQATIKALSVIPQPSGEMLGDAEDFILTATPGKPRGSTIPVSFTSSVGNDSRMVLADVLRAVNAKYPHVSAEKYEFSFEDKYVGHEGGSIGAACGTLMLSLIEDFDIDPTLAITGDVAANGRIHAIGGVAAKLRGAAQAGCNIVALPSENYDQIADAFIYDGPDSVINVQAIGITDLDQAVAVARADREARLKQAIDLFSSIQADLKKDPTRIHSPQMAQRLNEVLELAPNHYSAKLLYLMSQHQEPTTLSGAATYYYANVAVAQMIPGWKDKKPTVALASPTVVHDALAKLVKLRTCCDPQFARYVNCTWEFMRAMNDFQNGAGSQAEMRADAQLVLDEDAKLSMDRALMEKILHEGV